MYNEECEMKPRTGIQQDYDFILENRVSLSKFNTMRLHHLYESKEQVVKSSREEIRTKKHGRKKIYLEEAQTGSADKQVSKYKLVTTSTELWSYWSQ